MNTKAQALRAGKALLKKMKGYDWQVRVWENIGWHYEVHSGPVAVYPAGQGKYFCLISDDPQKGGSGLGLWTAQNSPSRKDPNQAVEEAVALVVEVVAKHIQVKRAALKAMGL